MNTINLPRKGIFSLSFTVKEEITVTDFYMKYELTLGIHPIESYTKLIELTPSDLLSPKDVYSVINLTKYQLEIIKKEENEIKVSSRKELFPKPKNMKLEVKFDEIKVGEINNEEREGLKRFYGDRKTKLNRRIYYQRNKYIIYDIKDKHVVRVRINQFWWLKETGIDNLISLPKLEYLEITRCKIHDHFNFPPQIKVLILRHNELKEIPPSILKLKSLEYLDLRNNEIKNLPVNIRNLKSLKSLNIQNNPLSDLPWDLSEFLGDLKILRLPTNNRLKYKWKSLDNFLRIFFFISKHWNRRNPEKAPYTTFPYERGLNSEGEVRISLSAYDYESWVRGTIPTKEADFLREFYMQKLLTSTHFSSFHEPMSGLPPIQIQNGHLKSLELSLYGKLNMPKSIEKLEHLIHLSLKGPWGKKKHVQLSSILKLKKLEILKVKNIDLKQLPQGISELSRLTVLELRNCNLCSLPKSLGNLKRITKLDISNNNFSTVPSAIGEFKELREVNFQKNKLNSLPSWLGDLKHLEQLYIEDNQITELPESLNKLKKLDLDSVKSKTLTKQIIINNLTERLREFQQTIPKPKKSEKRFSKKIIYNIVKNHSSFLENKLEPNLTIISDGDYILVSKGPSEVVYLLPVFEIDPIEFVFTSDGEPVVLPSKMDISRVKVNMDVDSDERDNIKKLTYTLVKFMLDFCGVGPDYWRVILNEDHYTVEIIESDFLRSDLSNLWEDPYIPPQLLKLEDYDDNLITIHVLPSKKGQDPLPTKKERRPEGEKVWEFSYLKKPFVIKKETLSHRERILDLWYTDMNKEKDLSDSKYKTGLDWLIVYRKDRDEDGSVHHRSGSVTETKKLLIAVLRTVNYVKETNLFLDTTNRPPIYQEAFHQNWGLRKKREEAWKSYGACQLCRAICDVLMSTKQIASLLCCSCRDSTSPCVKCKKRMGDW
ncbi:hypothetical protein CEE45_12605 [Candidatus Heimdallarchaeota archaeon B3_Heim]|nr:MAG: hypothetical protein CEE45_12605 [Candidatus Heimdallarchaeota archaeon B3_Heim]